MIYQQFNLVRRLRVLDNVLVGRLPNLSGWRRWAVPFVVFGVNALALYFLSTLMARALTLIHVGGATLKTAIFDRAFAPWASPVNASLAYASAYLLVWWLVLWALNRAGIRLRA